VGGPGAITDGLNRFPPVGLMLFSVGAGAGACELVVGDVVVVVVVDVDGALFPPPQAVNTMDPVAKMMKPIVL
jgi:hypothetical protein